MNISVFYSSFLFFNSAEFEIDKKMHFIDNDTARRKTIVLVFVFQIEHTFFFKSKATYFLIRHFPWPAWR